MEYFSKSREETAEIARKVLDNVLKTNRAGATVLALHGDLGAGKTAFVQELGKILGIKEDILSPTFIILKSYQLYLPPPTSGSYKLQATSHKPLYFHHIDAYRLNSSKELSVLGWEKLLSDSSNLIALEWPERVADIIPTDSIRISFEFMDPVRDREGSQRVSVSNGAGETTRKITV